MIESCSAEWVSIQDKALAKYVAELAEDIEDHWDGSDCRDYLNAVVADLRRNNGITNIWIER